VPPFGGGSLGALPSPAAIAAVREFGRALRDAMNGTGSGGVNLPEAAEMSGLQDDGSFVTPGGNSIRNHGRKGTGDIYIEGKGHTPESIDDILANPADEYDAAQGDAGTGGKRGAKVVVGQDGNWVVVNEDGQVIAVSDKNHPQRGKPAEKQDEPIENQNDKEN